MTTGQLIVVDHAVAVLSVVAWLATGVTAAVRRPRLALGLLAVAALVTLVRVTTVVTLAGRGWWFVQEKVLLGLPMLAAAGLAAVVIAGPRLLSAWRAPGAGGPDAGMPASGVVSLLTAGYAALAGLAVTFLAGYPLGAGTGLIAVSLVCAGALLTARVLATPVENTAEPGVGHPLPRLRQGPGAATPVPDPSGLSGVSRRRFIGIAGGAVVVGAGGTGLGLSFTPAPPVTTGGGPGASSGSGTAVSVAELRGPATPAPGGTTKTYAVTARTARVRLPSGRDLDAWTYGGQVPGPAITATEGDLIEVSLRNTDIDGGVTLHWHGYDVPCGEDGAPGVTQDVVSPGQEFVYRFRADQVGTFWYHTHQASHIGVRRGLYGTLVVTPRDRERIEQVDLTVPVHTFDGTVVVADQDGRTARTVPAGTSVRLRLINTDSDPHRFALAGTRFRLVAVDGRDLNEPGDVDEVGLRLAAGGRYDLVFVMPANPVALVLDNDHDGGLRLHPDGQVPDDQAPDGQAADERAGAESAVADTSGWPELDLLRYGKPAPVPFSPARSDRHFTMVLDRGIARVDGGPAYAQTVNGRGHPSIPDQLVTEGDVVRFTVVNRSLETHPWHLHGHPVLVLSRDGTASSGSPLWMDSFDVRPGEVWEVAFRATNPGIWMNHCHNLPHAHQGMMLRLRYDGVTTPFHGTHTALPAGAVRGRGHGH